MRQPELLVPASSLEVLKAAVIYGADAVYIGGEAFGLRAKAKNFSLKDMKEGVEFAHEHGVRVYVTANILAHNYDLEGVREYFEDLKRPNTPQYAVFQAQDGDSVVTLYESGKCVFQGKDADLASEFWVETEKINSGKAITTNSEDKKKQDKLDKINIIDPKIYYASTIGSDEVGTGDYFGPVCVCSCIIEENEFSLLDELHVTDSKQLTDNKIIEIAPKLIEKIKYSLLILDNQKYNEVHERYNLNAIKAKLHNKAYLNLLDKGYDIPKAAYVDEFAPKDIYFNYLKDEPRVYHDLIFETKAESSYPAVACASVIARYAFLEKMKQLENKYQMHFHLGAGEDTNEDIKKFVSKYGKDQLKEVAKVHFKNTEIIN